jgi:organic radical activating enzyme
VSKILIKIEEVKPEPFKRIAWKLSNVCNYNCNYCYPAEKDGSSPFIDIQTNKNVVDKLCELYAGEKILFNFTGGEPTLYPHLHELFTYIKQKNENHYISMFTNGSRTTRWWDEFLEVPVVDNIYFTFHNSQVKDVDKFVAVVNTIHDKEIDGLIFFTCTDIDFEDNIKKFNYVAEKVGISCHLKKIHGPILNKYDDEQAEILQLSRIKNGLLSSTKKKKSKINSFEQYGILLYDDGSVEKLSDPQEILVRGQNKFLGWKCDIGIERLVILVDKVQRGRCGVGGTISSIYDDFTPITTPVTCNKRICICGGEFFENKSSPLISVAKK